MDAWIGALKKRQITESADIIELLSQLHSWQQEGGIFRDKSGDLFFNLCYGWCAANFISKWLDREDDDD